jgi:hypothetical protein
MASRSLKEAIAPFFVEPGFEVVSGNFALFYYS